jgi:hypothetical protein
MALLPADDDGFTEADWLADALALTLGDDDALVVADVVAEGDEAAVCPGAALVQVEFGVGWIVCWPVASDVGLGLGVIVGVAVPLGVSLGLTVALGLTVVLGESVALELVVLPPLWLPLDDVSGAVAFSVGLLAELAVVAVSDACADDDGHELAVLCTITPGMLACDPSAVVGTGVLP